MLAEESILYWIILASFIMPLLLSVGLVYFFVSYIKRRQQYLIEMKDAQLREQALIIEKQNALQHERTRIAAEMHDDLGGGLTTIKFLSQKLKRKLSSEREKEEMTKITKQTQTLVTNMSEIIWAMNSGFDTVDNLIAYCRRYAVEFLTDHDIKLNFKGVEEASQIELTGEKRRNIFLVVKEALHNVVKHSGSDVVDLSFSLNNGSLKVVIGDCGVGLPQEIRVNGNGLINMEKRISSVGGSLELADNNPGLLVKMKVPL